MTQTIKLKRSAVASNVPTTGQVDLGEVAINTNDGAVYLKRDSGTPEVIAVHHDDTLYLDYTNNRVGIGTRIPAVDLDVNGTISTNGIIVNTSSTADFDITGADLQIGDSTNSGIVNFIWRDHSASRLYLGTQDDIVELRSDLRLQSGHSIIMDGTTVLTADRDLTNIASVTAEDITVSGAPELVTNGTFDTDTTGWTDWQGATLAVVSGQLQATRSATAGGQGAYQDINTVIGQTYVAEAEGYVGTATSWALRAYEGGSFTTLLADSGNLTNSTIASTSIEFTATTTTTRIYLRVAGSTGQTSFYDNASLKEVRPGIQLPRLHPDFAGVTAANAEGGSVDTQGGTVLTGLTLFTGYEDNGGKLTGINVEPSGNTVLYNYTDSSYIAGFKSDGTIITYNSIESSDSSDNYLLLDDDRDNANAATFSARSDLNFLIDANNGNTTSEFRVFANTNTPLSATPVFTIDQTGTVTSGTWNGGVSTNVETLSADKTLTNSDDIVQILNPNGAARNVDLPAEEANLRFIIKNNQSTSSTNTLTIRDDAGVALNLVLGAEQACEIVSDGISWFVTRTPQSHELSANGGLSLGSNSKAIGDQALAVGISASSSATYGVALGSGAQATATEGIGIGRLALSSATGAVSIGVNSDATQGSAIAIGNVAQSTGTVGAISIGGTSVSSGQEAVALGQSTDATSTGAIAIGGQAQATTGQNLIAVGRGANASGTQAISIGYNSVSSNVGTVAIGGGSDATQDGAIAIGDTAQATAIGSIALGDSSTADRASETAVNITGAATQDYARGSIGLQASTTTATPAELLCGGNAGERITIDADSVMVFEAMITGRDNTANEICAYKFSGVIKRDALNNTTLVQSNREIITEENASFDCTVAADDTNEALVFTVTATGTNATRWVGVVDYSEAKF